MAHAGTGTGLAKQPATSTINGLGQAVLAAIVLMAVVAASVFIGTNVVTRGSAVPAANHRIEAQRGPSTAAAALIYAGDSSYDQVEKNRGWIAAPAVDHRLDAIETQGGIAAPAVAPDRRFDELILAPASAGIYTQVETNRDGVTFNRQKAPSQMKGGFGGQ